AAAGPRAHRHRDRLRADGVRRSAGPPDLHVDWLARHRPHRRSGATRLAVRRPRSGMTAFIVAHAALWPVLVPLTGAGATACLRSRRGAQRAAASVSVVLMLASALLLLGIVQQHGMQVIRFGGWAPPFGVVFAVDALGAAMAAVTGLLGVAALVFGVADVRHRDERAGYYPLLLGLLAGVNGAFLTGDLFNLYVWFE